MSNVTAIAPRTSSAPAMTQEVYLSPAQVCELVPGIAVRTLRELRAAGRGPRYFKPTEKTVLYAESDIRAWIEASVVRPRKSS